LANVGRGHTRPVTLIIDDFHNCDQASIDLLSGILVNPDIGYSFMLLTSSLNTFEFEGFQNVDSTTIEMERLTDNEINSVLFNEFALSSIEPALAKKIHGTCEGNPGMAISYLRKLKDLEILSIDSENGHCNVKDSSSLAKFVSDDIKTSAIHMYDNVDKRSQYILRLASTTGNKSFLPMLKAMYIEGVSKIEQSDGKEQRDKKDSNSEADMIKKKFKEEAFEMRMSDLIEAKVILIDDGKLCIIVEGLAQVAYDVTLYTARHEAHMFVIDWYEKNCTREGLQMNASLLFQQCLSVNRYGRAAKYFYKCCNNKLKEGKPKTVLKFLSSSDSLLHRWKDQLLSEFEEASGVTKPSEPQSLTKRHVPDSTFDEGAQRPATLTNRGEGATSLRKRDTFTLFEKVDNETEEIRHNQTLENIAADFSIVLSVVDQEMKKEMKDNPALRTCLISAAFCENRCKFFEAQVYIELKKFLKARVILKEIIQFCTENGVKMQSGKKARAWTFVKKAMGWKGNKANRGVQPVLSSARGADPMDKSIGSSSDDDDKVTIHEVENLFQSASEVLNALKQLMTMQEQQQQVLRNIAANSRMDDFGLGLFRDSPANNSSSVSSPIEKSGRSFGSIRSPVFATPSGVDLAKAIKKDKEFKCTFDEEYFHSVALRGTNIN